MSLKSEIENRMEKKINWKQVLIVQNGCKGEEHLLDEEHRKANSHLCPEEENHAKGFFEKGLRGEIDGILVTITAKPQEIRSWLKILTSRSLLGWKKHLSLLIDISPLNVSITLSNLFFDNNMALQLKKCVPWLWRNVHFFSMLLNLLCEYYFCLVWEFQAAFFVYFFLQ